MSEYSNYKMVKVELTTEKAFLAIVENFTEKPIWVPKSVVGSDRRIKQWFINQKEKELKDFMRKKKQSDLDNLHIKYQCTKCHRGEYITLYELDNLMVY